MAKSKSTRTRSARPIAGNKGTLVPSDGSEAFSKLHYRLLLHVNQLRLVSNAFNEPAGERAEEAAAHVLPTLVRELD
jgi:hypothetical protein